MPSHRNAQMYCVKCKSKVDCPSARLSKDKRGRPRLSGTCPRCKTKVFKYVSMAK